MYLYTSKTESTTIINPITCTTEVTGDRGWSGVAMVLGKLPVPGRPTIWITVGQGPIALAVGAGGGCLNSFTPSIFSDIFLPVSGRRPYIN